MKVVFLGTGEAFDETNPNNSQIVLSKTNMLIDCGYSAAIQFWKYQTKEKLDSNFLDAIFISHRHADHYFGLPLILTRMWEEKRTKPIKIICQKDMKKLILDLLEFAYLGFPNKFEFKIEFIEVQEGERVKVNELSLNFAKTIHSAPNLAIKVSDGKNSFCYSGDGMFTDKTVNLYGNSDLIIHESYLYDEKKIGHTSIIDLLEMARKNNIKCLALTHLQRDFRREKLKFVKSKVKNEKFKVIIPEPFEIYSFD